MCTVLLPPGGNPIAVNKIYLILSNLCYGTCAVLTVQKESLHGPRADSSSELQRTPATRVATIYICYQSPSRRLCSGLFCCSVPTRTVLAVWLSNRALWIPEITLPKVYISQYYVSIAIKR